MESYGPMRIATNDAGLYPWLIRRPVRECVTWALSSESQKANLRLATCHFVLANMQLIFSNIARPLGLHYNHYVSSSVRSLEVSENAHSS